MDQNTKDALKVGDSGQGNADLSIKVDFAWGDVEDVLTLAELLDKSQQEDRAYRAVLYGVVDWLYGPRSPHPTGESRRALAIATRVYGMLYVMRPEVFGGLSIRKVAEEAGLSKSQLHECVAKFRATFPNIAAACRTVPQDIAGGSTMPQGIAEGQG